MPVNCPHHHSHLIASDTLVSDLILCLRFPTPVTPSLCVHPRSLLLLLLSYAHITFSCLCPLSLCTFPIRRSSFSPVYVPLILCYLTCIPPRNCQSNVSSSPSQPPFIPSYMSGRFPAKISRNLGRAGFAFGFGVACHVLIFFAPLGDFLIYLVRRLEFSEIITSFSMSPWHASPYWYFRVFIQHTW